MRGLFLCIFSRAMIVRNRAACQAVYAGKKLFALDARVRKYPVILGQATFKRGILKKIILTSTHLTEICIP
jgi:hypothetical protein